jgi:hypothetical protein
VPVVTTRLHVAEGQYWISDNDPDLEFVLPDPGGASGLVGVSPGLAIVITGTQFGNISVTVQAGDSDPGLDTGPWEEVTEVSLTSGPGGQGLSVTSDGQGPYEFQYLTPPGAGAYRVRVHARGRDAGAAEDVVPGRPVEEHLLQIWPALPAPETIYKTTDELGAGYREASASGPEPRLPHGQSVILDVHQPVTTTDRATVELLRIHVHRGGCEFTIKAVVDVSGMTAREEKRARRAVDGYRGAALPGTASADPLRVVLRFSDGRVTEFSDDPSDLPRSGPAITPCSSSNYPDDPRQVAEEGSWGWPLPPAEPFTSSNDPDSPRQVAEEGFWAWPLPPAEPFTLTLEWPAVGIPPASITVDGTIIAEAAAALPPD